jgi:hypothetical protein
MEVWAKMLYKIILLITTQMSRRHGGHIRQLHEQRSRLGFLDQPRARSPRAYSTHPRLGNSRRRRPCSLDGGAPSSGRPHHVRRFHFIPQQTLFELGTSYRAMGRDHRPNFLFPIFIEPCKTPTPLATLKRCDLYDLEEADARARLNAFLAPAPKLSRGVFPGAANAPPFRFLTKLHDSRSPARPHCLIFQSWSPHHRACQVRCHRPAVLRIRRDRNEEPFPQARQVVFWSRNTKSTQRA